jgi:hypothetical protein
VAPGTTTDIYLPLTGLFYGDRIGPVCVVESAMKKSALDQTASIHFGSNEGPWQDRSGLETGLEPGFENDPRWQLAQRVVDSPQFNKSTRLAKFLLYIVAKSLEGRPSEVTEQQIGVQVFGRSPGYRTVDDNIVRSYARLLRKRLSEYFARDGVDHPMRIEIPLGGYLPAFIGMALSTPVEFRQAQSKPILVERKMASPADFLTQPAIVPWHGWRRMLAGACLLVGYSAALIWLTCVVVVRAGAPHPVPEPAQELWKTMLQGPGNTYIVPPDAGLNLVEDLSHHPMPLADYIRGGYLDLPLPGVDAHSETDLRTQQLTGFRNLELLAALARLPEYSPAHVFLRFPRDLRFDDLKSANAVLIGSSCSNPWAVIAEKTTNFHIHCNSGMQGSTIVNLSPQPGEAASYASHWNEPIHETYAIITFIPNLSGYGHLLLLEGLDAAGTQAAGEVLLRSETIAPILERTRRPDGSLAAFELLLRSTSIQANATDTHVIASRID